MLWLKADDGVIHGKGKPVLGPFHVLSIPCDKDDKPHKL